MTYRVLVTGAGSPTGVGVIRGLRELDGGLHVIGADPADWSTGSAMSDTFVQCPWADSPDSEPWFRDVVAGERPDAAVVTICREIRAAWQAGVPAWMATPASVDVCEDKRAFASLMLDAGIPHPLTGWQQVVGDGPWFLKPFDGEGAKRTWLVSSRQTAVALMDEHPDLICQPRCRGDEWEVDVMADRGRLIGGVAFWKHRIRGGITMLAETFPLAVVRPIVEAVCAAAELDGPLNIGGFYDGDTTTVLEVNPRFSHGFRIGQAAGANPLRFYLDWCRDGTANPALLEARPGVRFERFYNETVN